ncbi:MAG TPA: hypothetical protein DCG57_03460 [Candidatus Riflebacteria bacterium]|jgi:uncharacterized membrane protein|nr:hypothetical protein [Candidatus Riflebacteria bacterium]
MSHTENNKISWREALKGIVFIAFSALVSGWATPFLVSNKEAVSIIVTAFSILAGFLMGMVSFVTDPAGFYPGGWKILSKQKSIIETRLARQQALFYLYLTSILFIVLALCIENKCHLKSFLEYGFVFLTSLSFIFSFSIPKWMKIYQIEKIDVLIQHRKEEEEKVERAEKEERASAPELENF